MANYSIGVAPVFKNNIILSFKAFQISHKGQAGMAEVCSILFWIVGSKFMKFLHKLKY